MKGRISDRKLKDKAIINYRKNITKSIPERKFNYSIQCGSAVNDIWILITIDTINVYLIKMVI